MVSKLKAWLITLLMFTSVSSVSAQTVADWHMAGANPARTSWVSEEVRGNLSVEWYQPIEPYIPYNFQPAFFNDHAYVATSKGLYVFNVAAGSSAGNPGRVAWVYPTDLPYGNSPTIAQVNSKTVVYLSSLDHTIHAIDTATHQMLAGYTPFQAGAGFSTNPVVVNNVIYAGNRDGYFYALNASTGALLWQYKTGDAILFSAAYSNGTVYFASNDLHAYALNAGNGTLKWKQGPFPTPGFFSYWPVVYREKATGNEFVIFTSAENYRNSDGMSFQIVDTNYIAYDCRNTTSTPCPETGTIFWPQSVVSDATSYFPQGTTVMDVHRLTEYYENPEYTHRRASYVLDADTGVEFTFDSDNDGLKEYAPFNWSNMTYSGTKYPGMVNGLDNIYYQAMIYSSHGYIPRGHMVGWQFGTNFVSRVSSTTYAGDEPMTYSGGGRMMYHTLMGERAGGGFDLSTPITQSNRSWGYYPYLSIKAPDYKIMYHNGDDNFYNNDNGWHMYGGINKSRNGIYSKHTTAQSPLIPYKGRVYTLHGNALISWIPGTATPMQLPLATIQQPTVRPPLPTTNMLQQKLEAELSKMIAAGHLRPGYFSSGMYDIYGQGKNVVDAYSREFGEIMDYFQNPAETVVTLINALPYISPELQTQVKTYLQTNYGPGRPYSFTSVVHVGWATGEKREFSDIPPETVSRYTSFATRTTPRCVNKDNCGWSAFPPYSFYAAWKYAQVFGGAKEIFDAMSSKLETPPTVNDSFKGKPYVINQYIAGYYGYLELQKLAGYPESTTVRNTYNALLALRISNFTKDTIFPGVGGGTSAYNYMDALSVGRNFMYMVPELADYLRQHAYAQFSEALSEYQYVAPYWFVTKFDATIGEGTLHQLYDTPALLQANAYFKRLPQAELVKYVDVPAFARGDLFYIQNLVAVIQADPTGNPQPSPTPAPKPGDANGDNRVDGVDYMVWRNHYNQAVSGPANGDFDNSGRVDGIDYMIWRNNYSR